MSSSPRRPPNRPATSVAAFLLTTAAWSCTSHRGPEQEPPRERPEITETSVAPTESVSPTDQPTAWRWIHRGDPGGWSVDIGPKQIEAGTSACSYAHDDEAHAAGQVCCAQRDSGGRWCVELREDFVPGVALESDGKRLYVADYPAISSGARFAAYDLGSGAQVWTREALAIGPQAHSEYFNVVQLRLVDDALIAYGDEAHGAYIESLDPASGALLRHTTLTPPTVQWTWDDAPEPDANVELALAGGGTCRFSNAEEGSSALTCERPGAPAWTHDLPAKFVGRGALISDGARIVVVTWCRIANGADARAFDLADGTELWTTEVEGIGPQDHSKYSNLIQLDVDGDAFVIRGDESHGRYMEAHAFASGALRWSIAWPS